MPHICMTETFVGEVQLCESLKKISGTKIYDEYQDVSLVVPFYWWQDV